MNVPLIITTPDFLRISPFSIEIARLQNSLQRLKRTQDELRPHADDPELAQALRENEAVMSVCPPSHILSIHQSTI